MKTQNRCTPWQFCLKTLTPPQGFWQKLQVPPLDFQPVCIYEYEFILILFEVETKNAKNKTKLFFLMSLTILVSGEGISFVFNYQRLK
jgi:hypothetical protein